MFIHQDKQLVLQIIQSGDIKPQRRVKEDYVIKTVTVSSQTTENNMKRNDFISVCFVF